MTERDPRVDPQPGDIIRFGGRYGGTFIEVLDPHGARLSRTDVSFIHDGIEAAISLNPWREWAKSSEIIRTAI